MVIGAAAASAVVVLAWFPASALLHQRQAIAAASTQLSQLSRQDQALVREQARLNSPAEIERIARQQYQLVSPGQQAYQVLPPADASTGATAPFPQDPGFQPPVSPSAAAVLPPGAAQVPGASSSQSTSGQSTSGLSGSGLSGSGLRTPSTIPTRAQPAPAAQGGFLHRIERALEFWK